MSWRGEETIGFDCVAKSSLIDARTKMETWKDQVREKLNEVFTENDEDLRKILFFLNNEDESYKDNVSQPYAPEWETLKVTIKSDKDFRLMAQRLLNKITGMTRDWQDEVREKLNEVFEGNYDDYCRILFFLDEEDKAYKDNPSRPYAPHWRSLKATLNSDEAFRKFAKRLAEETKRAEKDPRFRVFLNKMYEEMMSHSDDTVPLEQKLDAMRLFNVPQNTTSASGGFARAWSMLSVPSKRSALTFIKAIVADSATSTIVDDLVSVTNKLGGTVVMVGLAAVHLAYSAYTNIRRWWRGEISGKRCIKNLLDATFSNAAGVGGGFAGAALGSLLGPIGTVVGGIAGGWASAAGVNYLSDYLTQKLFQLPKEEALENAYSHLGVEMTATNVEVNTAFRKLCLKTHPDKPGGNTDDFFILQSNMAVIKQARGEF